jgi:two-component system, OmpR family, sensor kinase
MSRPARRTLVWRLYGVGLVQLVLLALAVSGVGWLTHGAPPEEPGLPPMHAHEMDLHDGNGPPPGPPGLPGPPGPPPGDHGPPPRRGSRPGLGPLVTFFISGVFIVGIGSFWTARWIVVPLERLSHAARALGAGDLGTRTGIGRDDELGDLGRAFDEMASRVQSLLLAEKELLANISHELRTPLARIRVALDIAGESDPEGGRLSLAEIAVDLAELDALIGDIFIATRLAVVDGKAPPLGFELHEEDLGPEVIAARAAERFRARHPRRPLVVTEGEDLPLVRVDPVLLRRALDNLLENANKYSPDPTTPITLTTTRVDPGVAFAVIDRGMGIAADDIPHLFTPFFRGERSRSRGTGGVGLGLTLTRRIVLAHRGAIDVESAIGRGTTMRVTIPTIAPA